MARLKKPLKGPTLVAEEELTDPQPVIESQEKPLEDEAPLEAPVERVPLGRLLVDAGFLTRAQLDECLFEGSKTGERIGEVVVRRNLATEDDIARLLAEQWGLDYVERSAIWFDGNALTKLSKEDAQRWEALPTRVEGGRVVVAVAEPTEQRIAAVRDLIGQETVLIVVPKSALDAGLRSSLLASRGGQFDAGNAPEPDPEPPLPPAAVEPEVEEMLPPPPRLAPVPPLPDLDPEPEPEPAPPPAAAAVEEGDILVDLTLTDDAEADAVQALAAEAQAVAERLAAQAAAARQRAAEQHELRAQAENYEARIATLEHELGERRAQVGKLREQLRSMLDSLPE
jgi:hypothetical protein